MTGEYAFVVPEGREVDVKYEADRDGFRVESDALPLSPDETDEVKRAREFFFQEYQKALERAGEEEEDDEEEDSDEDDDDSSSEESSEEEEGELSLFAYYGFPENDAEESSEEDSDEDEEEEEEEEEDEEEEKGEDKQVIRRGREHSRFIHSPAFAHLGRKVPIALRRK